MGRASNSKKQRRIKADVFAKLTPKEIRKMSHLIGIKKPNLDLLLAGKPMIISGEGMGLDKPINILYGETEEDLKRSFEEHCKTVTGNESLTVRSCFENEWIREVDIESLGLSWRIIESQTTEMGHFQTWGLYLFDEFTGRKQKIQLERWQNTPTKTLIEYAKARRNIAINYAKIKKLEPKTYSDHLNELVKEAEKGRFL